MTRDLEYRIVLPDGTVRWVAVRGQILADSEGKGRRAHGVMMDITARKQAEEALARESRERRRVEEQYRLVTAAANDAVYQVDPEGCIAFATPALARLTGYTMKELLGRPSTDLYTPETIPTFLERRRHALNGKADLPYLEANMLRKDGARVPVELAVTNEIWLMAKPVKWDGRCWIEITVSDTGIDISRENHRRIFDPCEQGEHGTLPLNNGVGLGLALCKQLVSVLGGEILVESTVGTGTTFRVLLPARRKTDQPRRNSTRGPVTEVPPEAHSQHRDHLSA